VGKGEGKCGAQGGLHEENLDALLKHNVLVRTKTILLNYIFFLKSI
jgi:hypothetical protein